ncbi:MAG: NfeD family protein [Pseudomonadota bacterium]
MSGSDIHALIWLVAGIGLVASEMLIPGLVAVFLGGAALIVAAVVWLGVVASVPAALGVWVVCSLALVAALRRVARKFLPAEFTRENTDEALSAYGTLVEVLEPCDDDQLVGRIRYQGTSWPARCLEGRVDEGEHARLLYQEKDGLGWVVEPVNALEGADKKGGN